MVTALSVAMRVWPMMWLPLHAGQAEALGNFPGQAHALEDLDALPGAHDAHARRQFSQGRTHRRFVGMDLQHRGAGVLEPVQRAAQAAFQRPIRVASRSRSVACKVSLTQPSATSSP
jgi:hypothetical protein